MSLLKNLKRTDGRLMDTKNPPTWEDSFNIYNKNNGFIDCTLPHPYLTKQYLYLWFQAEWHPRR